MYLLKLVRLPNLLIVALTQLIWYYHLLLPSFKQAGIKPLMRELDFLLLSATTVSIAAGGYLINDLLNIENDTVNKPARPLPAGSITEQVASWLYALLSITGFLFALLVAFNIGKVRLLFLYPVSIGLLYGYSAYAQRKVFIGNFLIAVFCTGVPAVVVAAEWKPLQVLAYRDPALYLNVLSIFAWYMAFAFLSNLYRELVKDLEDIRGDQSAGMQTLPIVFGLSTAKKWAALVGGLLCILLVGQIAWLDRLYPPAILLLFLMSVLPLAYSLFLLYAAKNSGQFRKISHLIKLVMLGGLLALLFV